MAAIVLGLLIASAKTAYDTQSQEVTEMAAKIVVLDRTLAHYGPEAQESRAMLREAVSRTVAALWPSRPRTAKLSPRGAGGETLYDSILQLSPRTDVQHALQAQALNIAMAIGNTRWILAMQQENSISMPLLVALISWLTVIFGSFGLHSRPNATVIATLCVCALSVSGAVFLILEMFTPFQGIIRIPSGALQHTLVQLGQ